MLGFLLLLLGRKTLIGAGTYSLKICTRGNVPKFDVLEPMIAGDRANSKCMRLVGTFRCEEAKLLQMDNNQKMLL